MHNVPSPPLVLLTALCETEKCDEEKIGFDQEPIFTQPTIAGIQKSVGFIVHLRQTDKKLSEGKRGTPSTTVYIFTHTSSRTATC